jgi:hypothetical protein
MVRLKAKQEDMNRLIVRLFLRLVLLPAHCCL